MKIRLPCIASMIALGWVLGCSKPTPATSLTPELQEILRNIFARADSVLVYEVSDDLWWPKAGVDTPQVIGGAVLAPDGAASHIGYPVVSLGHRLNPAQVKDLWRVSLDPRAFLDLRKLGMFQPLVGLQVFSGQGRYECLIDFRGSHWSWQTAESGGKVSGDFDRVKKRLVSVLGGAFDDNGRMARLMSL